MVHSNVDLIAELEGLRQKYRVQSIAPHMGESLPLATH